MSSGQTRSADADKALALLGQGLDISVVSSATGLSISRVSQLLSDDSFAAEVSELRYASLVKHTKTDNKVDELEDTILGMISDSLVFMSGKPIALAKVYQTLNGAKRRGAAAPAHIEKPADTAILSMPIQIINQYITNTNNQVIKAGDQELVTVQSSGMDRMLAASKALNGHSNETPLLERSA